MLTMPSVRVVIQYPSVALSFAIRIVLLINATLDLIQARAALEGLPFECTPLRVGRSVDKGHLRTALRADKPIINTDGVWLFRGHNSSRNFQDGSAIVSQPPDA
jgi:hypothetical protein